MRRALILPLAILVIALLQFYVFPGHTYLRSDTQIFVPMLERLDTPNFLSRDIVATTPHLVYTGYDEITLLLHRASHQNLERVLLIQLWLSRLGEFFGIYLFASAAGLRKAYALPVAVLASIASAFPPFGNLPAEIEPLPHTIAFGFCILATGLLCHYKPLLSGLAGGMALLYHPPTAASFWLAALLALVFDRKIRSLLRPAITVLIVFVLLLANLAQLQPGVVESQTFFGRLSSTWAKILHARVPKIFISEWTSVDLCLYLILCAVGFAGTVRTWRLLNRPSRWMISTFLICGTLSVPFSALLLDEIRWSLVAQIQPPRLLLLTIAVSMTAAGIAVFSDLRHGKGEKAAWCLVLLAGSVIVPAAMARAQESKPPTSIRTLSRWAGENTWGSSMFFFPDASRECYPGVFRTEATRAVYVDWKSGELSKYFERFATEWQARWTSTMQMGYSPERLAGMLSLPIDYYVLRRAHALKGIRTTFATEDFVVYEVHDLRNASLPLRQASANRQAFRLIPSFLSSSE